MTDASTDLPDLLAAEERRRWLRFVEAVLFASAEPVEEAVLRQRVPDAIDLDGILADLLETYAERGVTLVRNGTRWCFRTAADPGGMLRTEQIGRAACRERVCQYV